MWFYSSDQNEIRLNLSTNEIYPVFQVFHKTQIEPKLYIPHVVPPISEPDSIILREECNIYQILGLWQKVREYQWLTLISKALSRTRLNGSSQLTSKTTMVRLISFPFLHRGGKIIRNLHWFLAFVDVNRSRCRNILQPPYIFYELLLLEAKLWD